MTFLMNTRTQKKKKNKTRENKGPEDYDEEVKNVINLFVSIRS